MIDYDLISHDIYSQGFHIIDGFLDNYYCQSLRKIAEKMHRDGLFKSAKIGLNNQAQLNSTIRADEIFWLNEYATGLELDAYLKQAQLVSNALNRSLYLGLSEFDTHFALYKPGSFYKKHVDQFTTTKTRKISCVYYLNLNWTEEDGGELKLYNKKDQLIQTVFPIENRFICFNSELPHEVCLTYKIRYSITGWMKTRP